MILRRIFSIKHELKISARSERRNKGECERLIAEPPTRIF
jgi:hypothetical protein